MSNATPHLALNPHFIPAAITVATSIILRSGTVASFSPSPNEADGERSPSPLHIHHPNTETMRPSPRPTPAQYEGEDTRPTSSRELLAWYCIPTSIMILP